ncbi:MAG: hypothetical protein JRJ02_00760 [Deltaproteobacteria bacterium]|nr:hypothetical protein [Deltaproteobacteria bacterium]
MRIKTETKGAAAKKILRVNLSKQTLEEEGAERYEERFIGGRGVNSWIVFNEIKPETKPLDPENVIAIGAGPLAGSSFPCSAYTSIASKNLNTGGINWTHSGGHFASSLRHAGWSNIIVTGKSERPVYLYINDGLAEIRDAKAVWKKDVWDSQDRIIEELQEPGLRFASIGTAGANLVPSACVITDRTRACANGGIGAIFGSKNLKCIAVKGAGETDIADPERFKAFVKKLWKRLEKSEFTKMLGSDGTLALMNLQNDIGTFPFRNTQDDFYADLDKSSVAYSHWKKIDEKYDSCYNCPIKCGSVMYEADEGPYKGLKINGPENNTFYTFASRLNMTMPSNILKVFELVSRYGLDQDLVGVSIAWAFECFEKGILTRKDVDGLDLTWGNDESVINLIHKIANKEGFGELLGKGTVKAAEVVGKGSGYYSTALKGQDNLDALRVCKAWGLGNTTSLRGGKHMDGAPSSELMGLPPELCEKLFGIPTAGNPTTYEGKGKLVALHTMYKAAIDTLGVCFFSSFVMDPQDGITMEEFAEALSAATGREISGDEFIKIGDRIHNVEKAFNTLHAGFLRKDDDPPQVYMKEPVKSGKFKGEIITREGQDKMLDEFYESKGWDLQTSWQRKKILVALELPEVAEALFKASKLID